MDIVKAQDLLRTVNIEFNVYTVKQGTFTYYGPFVPKYSLDRKQAEELAEALVMVVKELKQPTPAMQALSKLAELASETREAQVRFFKTRQNSDLQHSKRKERELDDFLKDYEKGIVESQPKLF